MSKIYNYSKNILIFFGFCYLFYESYKNYDYIALTVNSHLTLIFCIILIHLFHHNLVSYRNYIGYKIATNYNSNFLFWSKIFFQSILLNTFISHFGSVYRAIELKKKNVIYKDFISIFYILFGLYIGINLILVSLELLIFGNFNLKNQIFIASIILLIVLIIIYLPQIFFYLIYFFSKFKIKFFCKVFDIAYYIKNFCILKINTILKSLTLITVIIHFIEILIFFLYCKIFFKQILLIDVFFMLFCLSFFIDRIPYMSQIPGLNELLFVYMSTPFGLDLIDTFFVKAAMRFNGINSIVINVFFFNLLQLFINKKNLNNL